jgi:hypothetical protein
MIGNERRTAEENGAACIVTKTIHEAPFSVPFSEPMRIARHIIDSVVGFGEDLLPGYRQYMRSVKKVPLP